MVPSFAVKSPVPPVAPPAVPVNFKMFVFVNVSPVKSVSGVAGPAVPVVIP